MSFLARYDSVCVNCEGKITAGKDEIERYNEDSWVHEFCPEPVPGEEAVGRNERMCGDCFTIHAGACL